MDNRSKRDRIRFGLSNCQHERTSGIEIVPPGPLTLASIEQIYIDGSIGANRSVPIVGKASLGVVAQSAFTLAGVLKMWEVTGRWDFASGITVLNVWTEVTASFAAGRVGTSSSDSASNLFDLFFTPIVAGHHFSQTAHISLSFNFWALTSHYNQNALANASLNNWTFVPQVAFTSLFRNMDWNSMSSAASISKQKTRRQTIRTHRFLRSTHWL